MDYTVELPTFRGPLDLLLFLVKHNEVDLYDIPIAIITEQFLNYINLIQAIDVEAVASVETVTTIGKYLQQSGGKRLRPALLLLCIESGLRLTGQVVG